MALNFFLRMLLGHLVGDFILQPYKIAVAKRAGWRGLLLHVSIVTFTTGVALYQVVPDWLFWTGVLFVVHLFIDQFRTYIFTDNSKGKSFFFFVLDQIVHVISLMIISNLAVGWQFSDLAPIFTSLPMERVDTMLLFSCILIVAIWVVPILEVELATAIISRQTKTEEKLLVPIRRSDRLWGGIERLSSVILILISHSFSLLIPLIFLPRLFWLFKEDVAPNKVAIYSKTGTSFITAIVISVPLWLLTLL